MKVEGNRRIKHVSEIRTIVRIKMLFLCSLAVVSLSLNPALSIILIVVLLLGAKPYPQILLGKYFVDLFVLTESTITFNPNTGMLNGQTLSFKASKYLTVLFDEDVQELTLNYDRLELRYK